MRNRMHWAMASVVVVLLASCGAQDKAGTGPGSSAKSLAATVKDDAAFGTLEGVLNNAGLTSVLEGVGPYTVFAPSDAAFQAAGAQADFADDSMRAQAAALLRSHIVPGAMTRKDIGAAIDHAGSGGAKMRTMSDGMLTFTREGGAIVVTGENGATARLTGDERLAGNGVLQPVDGLLVKSDATPASAPAA